MTAKIIAAIAAKRQLDEEAARQTWAGCLREAQSSPRWHDYAFHCSQLELGEVWKIPAYEESESLLSLNARHEQVIGDVKGALVECWVVSDATDWVVRFKLAKVHLSAFPFKELFTLRPGCAQVIERLLENRARSPSSKPHFVPH